jgi:hypothetical protein
MSCRDCTPALMALFVLVAQPLFVIVGLMYLARVLRELCEKGVRVRTVKLAVLFACLLGIPAESVPSPSSTRRASPISRPTRGRA